MKRNPKRRSFIWTWDIIFQNWLNRPYSINNTVPRRLFRKSKQLNFFLGFTVQKWSKGIETYRLDIGLGVWKKGNGKKKFLLIKIKRSQNEPRIPTPTVPVGR